MLGEGAFDIHRGYRQGGVPEKRKTAGHHKTPLTANKNCRTPI